MPESAVRAVDFKSTEVYRSKQRPSYTSWVSFFPGERGQWYLTCEEVTVPETPLPRCTPEQRYELSLPANMDKSTYLMEIVILQSDDGMETWRVVSRQPCRFQHSAGSFAQARTKDGRFLRFVWGKYSLDPDIRHNEVFHQSRDNGKTWEKMPPFHDARFLSWPHRLRTLRDGTLVLCLPLQLVYGSGSNRPTRLATNPYATNGHQMNICFSYDQGITWSNPLPIYGGQNVTETDFVELPAGDLLFINNSIFGDPGRQFVYKTGHGWVPGEYERVRHAETFVPETVCLTEENMLVGCIRTSTYCWSDDLGLTWWSLEGIPDCGVECYQPWIQYLGDGQVACAGHYGGDVPVGSIDQYIMLHTFRLETIRRPQETRIEVVRDYVESEERWPNAYTVKLTSNDKPLPDKRLELWYVEQGQPGYDDWNRTHIEERMKMGGRVISARTDANGIAHFSIPHFDNTKNPHYFYQFMVRFNSDYSDPQYKLGESPLFGAWAHIEMR